jgi:hypothetical protein
MRFAGQATPIGPAVDWRDVVTSVRLVRPDSARRRFQNGWSAEFVRRGFGSSECGRTIGSRRRALVWQCLSAQAVREFYPAAPSRRNTQRPQNSVSRHSLMELSFMKKPRSNQQGTATWAKHRRVRNLIYPPVWISREHASFLTRSDSLRLSGRSLARTEPH